MIKIEIDKIRSYQQMLKKDAKGPYRSTDFKVYRLKLMESLKSQKYPVLDTKGKICIELHFFSKRANLGDFDNITKAVVDVLQDVYGFNDKNIIKAEITKNERIKNLKKDLIIIELKNIDEDYLLKKLDKKFFK